MRQRVDLTPEQADRLRGRLGKVTVSHFLARLVEAAARGDAVIGVADLIHELKAAGSPYRPRQARPATARPDTPAGGRGRRPRG